jgi:23S rRNA pseudouridine1911/1915/1917 synthase
VEEPRRWQVGPGEEGWRLDLFVARAVGGSRRRARALLEAGRVALDGRVADASAKGVPLRAGQAVDVHGGLEVAGAAADLRPIPEPEAALQVLARGPGWLAVAKPAGVPVHPLAPDERGSLLGALVARHPELIGVGEGGLRSGVVHRLDVDTSGVLLFATEQERWQSLRNAFRRHKVEKVYRALVHGRVEGEGELSVHLCVAQHRPARVRVVEPEDPRFGRRSRLTSMRWCSLVSGERASLLEVRPRTGFLHQIRASLAHLGHPVLGDQAYGAPATPGVERHLLHAARVAWSDVAAGCPDPPDFERALAELVEPS